MLLIVIKMIMEKYSYCKNNKDICNSKNNIKYKQFLNVKYLFFYLKLVMVLKFWNWLLYYLVNFSIRILSCIHPKAWKFHILFWISTANWPSTTKNYSIIIATNNVNKNIDITFNALLYDCISILNITYQYKSFETNQKNINIRNIEIFKFRKREKEREIF